MIDFLQQRIKSKEFGILVALVILTTVSAFIISSRFITDDWDTKERQIKNLKKELGFANGRRNGFGDMPQPSNMKNEIARLQKKLKALGMTPDGEIKTEKKQVSTNKAEIEIQAAAVISMLQRSRLNIINADRANGQNQNRTIKVAGTFNNLFRALESLSEMKIGVSDLTLKRKTDSDLLDIDLRISL